MTTDQLYFLWCLGWLIIGLGLAGYVAIDAGNWLRSLLRASGRWLDRTNRDAPRLQRRLETLEERLERER